MRIVSLLAPIKCGVYRFHCNLVQGLAPRGCSITWLCSGSEHASQIVAEDAEQSDGEVVAPDIDKLAARTRALTERIGEIAPDVLLCHALGDPVDFNAIRYLPGSITKVLVLHNSTLAVYRSARVVRDQVNATVAISPRIKQDLLSAYGFREERLRFIPHGVDTSIYLRHTSREKTNGPLRILSHGRIDNAQKGVFWLPQILAELARHDFNWSCTISGDGPDLAELKRRIAHAGLSARVQFVGWAAAEDIPELMSGHDVFLFPTKYEGYPIALIEAMAAGCVPVASRLPGVTDWVIQHGANGLLFPIGDVRRAVQHIRALLSGRSRLSKLRQQAQLTVNKYSLDWMAEQYYQLFREALTGPQQMGQAENPDTYKLANGLKPAWWSGLPEPIKNHLRIVRENLRAFIRLP
jgi:glycosyltransferase involved in cell wall biosynthesis